MKMFSRRPKGSNLHWLCQNTMTWKQQHTSTCKQNAEQQMSEQLQDSSDWPEIVPERELTACVVFMFVNEGQTTTNMGTATNNYWCISAATNTHATIINCFCTTATTTMTHINFIVSHTKPSATRLPLSKPFPFQPDVPAPHPLHSSTTPPPHPCATVTIWSP